MAFVAKYTVPLVGVSSAASKCNKVLLPAPDGATIATISPCRKLKFASARTEMLFSPLPYVFFRPRDSRTTVALGRACVATPLANCVCWVILPLAFRRHPAPSLLFNLDASGAIPVPQQRSARYLCRNLPKVFPISASPLPTAKRAILRQTETLIIFLFSTACRGYLLRPRVEGCAPVSPTCLSALVGANLAPN